MMDPPAWVWTYHDQVALMTAAKNKIKATFRAAGVQYTFQLHKNPGHERAF
jgi:hypothetical protein